VGLAAKAQTLARKEKSLATEWNSFNRKALRFAAKGL